MVDTARYPLLVLTRVTREAENERLQEDACERPAVATR